MVLRSGTTTLRIVQEKVAKHNLVGFNCKYINEKNHGKTIFKPNNKNVEKIIFMSWNCLAPPTHRKKDKAILNKQIHKLL